MKKLFILIACVAITGCRSKAPETSICNYKNSVIIDRFREDSLYLMKIRQRRVYVRTGVISYELITVRVPKYEYNFYQIGDTIK